MKPSEFKKALIMRESGFGLSAISQELNISTSTLYRHFSKHGATKGGSNKEALQAAKRKLLTDAGLIGELKGLIASSIADDLALVRQLRHGIAISIDELINDSTTPHTLKSRAYAALSVSVKTTSEIARKCLNVNDESFISHEIPQLNISRMSSEDVKRIRELVTENEEEKVSNDLL